MQSSTYIDRRQQLKVHFDRTAYQTWQQLISDAPVSRIRQATQQSRQSMIDLLLGWLPANLSGKRLLDAGCGTGALCLEAARRGAVVVGIDLSPSVIELAKARTPVELSNQISYQVGDMLTADANAFDYVVALDSLIHYEPKDIVNAISLLQNNTRNQDGRVLFTFAPKSPTQTLLSRVGKLLSTTERSPAVKPVTEKLLRLLIDKQLHNRTRILNTQRVSSIYYQSQGVELTRH